MPNFEKELSVEKAIKEDVSKKVDRLAQEDYKDIITYIEVDKRFDEIERSIEYIQKERDLALNKKFKLEAELEEAIEKVMMGGYPMAGLELMEVNKRRKASDELLSSHMKKIAELLDERYLAYKELAGMLEIESKRLKAFENEKRQLELNLLPPIKPPSQN